MLRFNLLGNPEGAQRAGCCPASDNKGPDSLPITPHAQHLLLPTTNSSLWACDRSLPSMAHVVMTAVRSTPRQKVRAVRGCASIAAAAIFEPPDTKVPHVGGTCQDTWSLGADWGVLFCKGSCVPPSRICVPHCCAGFEMLRSPCHVLAFEMLRSPCGSFEMLRSPCHVLAFEVLRSPCGS